MTRGRGWVRIALVVLLCATSISLTGSVLAATATASQPVTKEFNATEDVAHPQFPNSIAFALKGTADFTVKQVQLLYALDGDETLNLVTPQFSPGKKIDVSHDLDMRVNFVPAGIDLTYHWRLTGDDGAVAETKPQTFTWKDDRFDWKSVSTSQVTVYAYNGDKSFNNKILASAQSTIDRLQTEWKVERSVPIRIWVYSNRKDFQGAQAANSESWIVGTAYPQFHVILAVLPDGDTAEVGRVIPHEISHQLLHQATENPFNSPPTWMDEGLAVMNQRGGDQDYPSLVQDAADQGKLFSVRALDAQFPLDPADANLAYAESLSIVTFIVNHYGQDKLAALIDVFRQGVSFDEATKKALGVDLDGLDQAWKASLGYKGDRGQAGGLSPERHGSSPWGDALASGAIFMGLAAVVAVAAGLFTIRRNRHGGQVDDQLEL